MVYTTFRLHACLFIQPWSTRDIVLIVRLDGWQWPIPVVDYSGPCCSRTTHLRMGAVPSTNHCLWMHGLWSMQQQCRDRDGGCEDCREGLAEMLQPPGTHLWPHPNRMLPLHSRAVDDARAPWQQCSTPIRDGIPNRPKPILTKRTLLCHNIIYHPQTTVDYGMELMYLTDLTIKIYLKLLAKWLNPLVRIYIYIELYGWFSHENISNPPLRCNHQPEYILVDWWRWWLNPLVISCDLTLWLIWVTTNQSISCMIISTYNNYPIIYIMINNRGVSHWYTTYHHLPVVKGVSSNPSIHQPTNGKRTSMIGFVVDIWWFPIHGGTPKSSMFS